MKRSHFGLFVCALILSIEVNASARVTQVGNYNLGESGSVGSAASWYTSLTDSIGGHNINAFQNPGGAGGQIVAIKTNGLAAPGSTAALLMSQQATAQQNAGWYGNSTPYGLTNNWMVNFWYLPIQLTTSANSYVLFSTDSSSGGLSIALNNNTMTVLAGATVQANQKTVLMQGGAYSTNAWQQLTLIDYNGNLSLYQSGSLTASSSNYGAASLNQPEIALGPYANAERGAAGAWDLLTVWTFDPVQDSLSTVQADITNLAGVPEPSTYALFGLGTIGMLMVMRRMKTT